MTFCCYALLGVFDFVCCVCCRFYTRWKEWESWYSQSFGLHFSLREEQWQEDWAFILSLASQVYMLSRTLSHALCREAVIGLGILFLTSVSHIIIEQPCWQD